MTWARTRSPGRLWRTKTTLPSGARATQPPPAAMAPTSSSRKSGISAAAMAGERRTANLINVSKFQFKSFGARVSIRAVPDRRKGETNPTKENTMRYLLMIALDESAGLRDAELAGDEISPEYAAFMKDVAERGVLLGGERLRLTSDATTVRVRNGEILTTDGPFAETKEQLAGYFLVDCKDLDEAIDVASRIPGAKDGSIEVRPIWEM